ESAPTLRPGFDFFADCRRHGEDARIATGDDGDARALRGVMERSGSARTLLAIVGSVAALARARRHPIEIRAVTVERLRGRKRVVGFRREVARIARSQSDDGKVPGHVFTPGRRSQPGTKTT